MTTDAENRHAERVARFPEHVAAGKCVDNWGSIPCRNRAKRGDHLCGTHGNSYDYAVARDRHRADERRALGESRTLRESLLHVGIAAVDMPRSDLAGVWLNADTVAALVARLQVTR